MHRCLPRPVSPKRASSLCHSITTTTYIKPVYIAAYIVRSNMSPRIARLASPLFYRSQTPVQFQFRIITSRFSTSTSSEDAVIKPQQVPATGSGHVRVLLLNRPDARNALSTQMLDSLSDHIHSISAEQGQGPTRALVIASNADSAFCAGADLKERATMSIQE